MAGPAAHVQPPSRAGPGQRAEGHQRRTGRSGCRRHLAAGERAQHHPVRGVRGHLHGSHGPRGEWVQKFARTNGFRTNDAVLAVATQSKQARFVANSSGPLSRSDQQKIYDEHIAPALRTGDWDGAAQAPWTGSTGSSAGRAPAAP
ncbi:TPM domain-containing protein [Kocuria rhizophila]|nr:TPM domain-containing protein [Kocuria rhizophila]